MRKSIFPLVLSMAITAGAQTNLSRPAGTFADYPPDRSLDACTDFHAYACANWERAHPIPSDRSSYGTGSSVFDWNQAVLRDILETTSKGGTGRNETDRKIGDAYASCLDEAAIEKRGLAAIRPELDRIAALKSKKELPKLLARLHRVTANLSPQTDSGFPTAAFGLASTSDFANAELIVAGIDQGGLGLPDREYYFRTDDKAKATRDAYQDVIGKMLRLAGASEAKANADAKTVMAMETDLARGSLDIVTRRDPANVNHPMSFAELQKLTPQFDWTAYLGELGVPQPHHYLVYAPAFLKSFDTALAQHSLSDWKAYLRWNLLNLSTENLPRAFRTTRFEFFDKTLIGRKEQRPRWKVCADAVDRDLGELVGQAYVARAFPPSSKERMLKLVRALKVAFEEDVASLDWMSDATKTQARQKLSTILDKIGYPDKWRDYSRLDIVRNDALGNAYRASAVVVARDLAKIGKPRDRSDWAMTPPTVNAYYSTSDNTINFPAGILQPPFFDANATDAENFGAIGAVIGHELTHGFDDQGRKFDANGNLRDWWGPEDAAKFEERAKCISEQYSSFVAVDDVHLNGAQTLGENAADNGGLRIALRALHNVLREQGKENEVVNGLTADQRFFLAFGHVWCGTQSPQLLRLLAQTNVHSPARFRINGVVANMPEFRAAFGCKAGQAMVRDPACMVW
ncbi:MAG: putative endopeptidase [Thermoanaerobaculia bacterium]|nr:putative endopeptidase [Thermoanaerobaculia bacterium]